jgi:glycosyltransferase involved in cell wall biosynthesis
MMVPLISVVIPTYKRKALLLRCVEALSRQSFIKPHFEVIIVSDGPDDETKHAVETTAGALYPDLAIHYIVLPAKRGPAAARNLGWQNAKAALIAFTDDDCIPHTEWLRQLYDAYIRKGLKDVAFTGRTIVPIPATPTDYERNIANLERAEFITANCAATRTTLEKINGLDEAFTMAWREDSDFQFRLIQQNIPIIPVKEACVTHPVRKAPWGICIREEKKGMFNPLLMKKHPKLCKEKISITPPWYYYMMVACCIAVVIGILAGITNWLLYPALAIWMALLVDFTRKRLLYTSRSFSHVMEMVLTSPLLPFLSIYWWWYGAFRFHVFSVSIRKR